MYGKPWQVNTSKDGSSLRLIAPMRFVCKEARGPEIAGAAQPSALHFIFAKRAVAVRLTLHLLGRAVGHLGKLGEVSGKLSDDVDPREGVDRSTAFADSQSNTRMPISIIGMPRGLGSTFKKYYPEYYDLALSYGFDPALKPTRLDISERR
jgi:hypothetical protein